MYTPAVGRGGLMTTKWTGWIVAALALAALAAGAVYAATNTAEVRITARQAEDGRIEFAFQQRVDGEWGERILPASRFFPANVGHNRWLNSSPLTITTEPEQSVVQRNGYTPQRVGEGRNDDDSLFWNVLDTASGLQSFLGVIGTTNDGLYDKAVVYISCLHDAPEPAITMQVRHFWAIGDRVDLASDYNRDEFAGYRFGTTYDSTAVTGNTDDGLVSVSDVGVWLRGDNLLQVAKTKRWLQVASYIFGSPVTATFDMNGAWNTPVQRNLDNCAGS